MTKQLSTKVSRLDLNFILDNCFKPNLWDKVWTIFIYNGWKITFELSSIDVKSKKVYYSLKIYNPNDVNPYYVTSTSGDINFQKEHRNLDVIQKGINNKILRYLIDIEERALIRNTTAYKEAKEYERDYNDLIEKKATDLLDELGISNEDIRSAYVDSQVNKLSTSKFTDDVYKLYKGSKLTKLYMSYCLFVSDKDNYDSFKKIAKLNGFKVGDLRKEIKENLAKIEIGEMYDDLEMDTVM